MPNCNRCQNQHSMPIYIIFLNRKFFETVMVGNGHKLYGHKNITRPQKIIRTQNSLCEHNLFYGRFRLGENFNFGAISELRPRKQNKNFKRQVMCALSNETWIRHFSLDWTVPDVPLSIDDEIFFAFLVN